MKILPFCNVSFSIISWVFHCRMYPVAWENARFLDEDIIIQGYRIPSKVRKKVTWLGVVKVSVYPKIYLFSGKKTFSDRSYCDPSLNKNFITIEFVSVDFLTFYAEFWRFCPIRSISRPKKNFYFLLVSKVE